MGSVPNTDLEKYAEQKPAETKPEEQKQEQTTPTPADAPEKKE